MKQKKTKITSIMIAGTLIITAFFQGHALDTALGIFFGLLLVYAIVRFAASKIKAKSEDKSDDFDDDDDI